MGSTIEWTDETWNPTVGCSKTSPGCDNCYAINVAHRAMQPAHEGLTIVQDHDRPDWTGEVRLLPDRLTTPMRWRKPRRVFVDSMSDLFHADVPDDFIAQVFRTMAAAPAHTFQVLTKRPQRMAAWTNRVQRCEAWWTLDGQKASKGGVLIDSPTWPIPNVWLGTSIESDRYSWRADHLRATPAAVRFLSLEPLLGPLPSLDLTGIDWVIVGGESGPGARPMHSQWVRDIRDRCTDAGVAFFFKQWGSWRPQPIYSTDSRHRVLMLDGTLRGTPWGGWKRDQPDAEVVESVSKHTAGRHLDDRTWDEMPSTQRADGIFADDATAVLSGRADQ